MYDSYIQVKSNIALEYVKHGDRFYKKIAEEDSPKNDYMVMETLKQEFELMNSFGHTLTVTYNQLREENWSFYQIPFWARNKLGFR